MRSISSKLHVTTVISYIVCGNWKLFGNLHMTTV
jgi:hypothetical protein